MSGEQSRIVPDVDVARPRASRRRVSIRTLLFDPLSPGVLFLVASITSALLGLPSLSWLAAGGLVGYSLSGST